jgi:acyl carrier protein
MPDPQPSSTFFAKDAETLRHDLRGFPAWGVEAVLRFQQTRAVEDFSEAVLGVLEFYLPKAQDQDLRSRPAETRLREDLGVDSLSMTEAAFKLEEVFDFSVDSRELIIVETLGDMRDYFKRKLNTPLQAGA